MGLDVVQRRCYFQHMPSDRLHWADTAKALAVVMVVVYHVSLTAVTNIATGGAYSAHFWGLLSTWLLPVRIPLFFLVSGVLATDALQRTWRRIMRPRILDHVWPFWLWTVCISALYAWAYAPQAFGEFTTRALTWTLTFGGFYWYLPLLMLFFVTAKYLRRLPVLVIGGSMFLYFIAPDLPRDVGHPVGNDAMLSVIRYCQFLLWFAIGAFLRPLVERWAKVPAPVMIVAGFLYVPIAARYYNGGELDLPSLLSGLGIERVHLTPVLSVLGITVALGLSRVTSRLKMVRRLGRYLAERTLPIYLVHPVVVTVLVLVAPPLAPLSPVTTAVLVPMLVAALVALSTSIYDRSRNVAPWLYKLPGSPGQEKAAVSASQCDQQAE